jgi:hypothetical protein
MYLKVKELPATKLRLKKALINKEIICLESDYNAQDTSYKAIDLNHLLKMWDGFHYNIKGNNQDAEGWACLGTSYYYKFIKA